MSKILPLTLALFIFAQGPALPKNTQLQEVLERRIERYSLSANGLVDALARTAKDFDVPIGVEWVKENGALRGLDMEWKGRTVGVILRSIVSHYPGYELRVEHHVVHVFRQDLVSSRHNFLNLKVPGDFEVRAEQGGLINQRLRAVVQRIVAPRTLPPGAGEGGSYGSGLHEKKLTLRLGGATIREALEKLIEVSQHKVWVVTFSDDVHLTPTGFYRTETLWHPSPFPDAEQPVWDFIPWESYPFDSGAAGPHP